MRTTIAPAGQRTEIYKIRQGSIPMHFDFTVEPVEDGAKLSGVLEVTSSAWIIPQAPQRLPLQARHQVKRGMFNTFFTLAVIPDVEVRVAPVRDDEGGGSGKIFVLVLGLLIGLILAMAIGMFFLGGR
ncbi:hypothetical protein FEM03_20720 [Phragmitibacter flavus]|uniref:Uncharacterized protein n=1 Tax=Phragmitibacter flavus TaxID=2576071 RepID=A0A5R8K8Z4_9BACT|nr:hypothetical protein [Phragmitibacter flavus]TLD68760.1 hypothetical protein FEM03_20720 [Phragmitibacter flavus]